MGQICQKRVFLVKTQPLNSVYLNYSSWFFWPNLIKKGIFSQKRKKWTSPLNSAYSSYPWYRISAETSNLDILDQICPKRVFLVGNGKIALVRAPMVVTYYIKLFRMEVGRHNGILISLLLLVTETINGFQKSHFFSLKNRLICTRLWRSY